MDGRRSTALPVRHAVPPHQLVENRKRSCRLLSFSAGINSSLCRLASPRRHRPRLYTESLDLSSPVSGENIIVGGAPILFRVSFARNWLPRRPLPRSCDRGNSNVRKLHLESRILGNLFTIIANFGASFELPFFYPCLPREELVEIFRLGELMTL